jgi:arylsulfatase A-like enzyme
MTGIRAWRGLREELNGSAFMRSTLPSTDPRQLSGISILIWAAWFGLVGGYLDLGAIFFNRDVLHASLYYEQGRHFRWTVPLASVAFMIIPGLLLVAMSRMRIGLVSARTVAWLLATLAIWGPLLRAPLYGVATLLVAVGLGRLVSTWCARHQAGFGRFVRYSLAGLVVLLVSTAGVALRSRALAESRALASLPAPPAGARNVVLIVMDTVRADSMSLHGYVRDTTPQLARWAKQGVRFEWALAPAPWTFPSHCSFLTGHWPSTLGVHWDTVLDAPVPTLAEFLASRGYVTAGFAANTFWCSYESRMDRGFAHYEDYPLTPSTILGATMLGRWLLTNLRHPGDYSSVKWIRAQSRDAKGINRAFLEWLARERDGARPFFAFLNYLDAHEPFLPPEHEGRHFGFRPQSANESRMLLDYWDLDKLKLSPHEVTLARDSYDTCIAALDRQLGALLDELARRGALQDTLVIITSDHGEELGEHGVFNHGFSLYAHEVHVPLVILDPRAPAGRTVAKPVSLRDIPATVVDLCGLGASSPFPGFSLGEFWSAAGRARASRASQPLSEVYVPVDVPPQRGRGPFQHGFAMSLVQEGLHYLLDVHGTDKLYDLAADPPELHDLKLAPDSNIALERLRSALLRTVPDEPGASSLAPIFRRRLIDLLGSLLAKPSAARKAIE